MLFRSWALAVLLALSAPAVAWAAPTTVQLRVEGQGATIFEGPVTTDGHAVDGKDGSGPHPCDGTNAGANPSPGPTMTSALDDSGVPWEGPWNSTFSDFFVNNIGGEAPTRFSFWGTVLNFQPTSVGGCQQQVQAGDEALFALGTGSEPFLRLTGPSQAEVGQSVTVSVNDAQGPVAGAAIAGASGAQTGADGSAAVSFASPGIKRLKAEKAGSIRSNSLFICVPEPGAGGCQGAVPVALPGLAPPATAGVIGGAGARVRDSRAPTARISAPRHGRRYGRGPRLVSGSASDAESGIAEVKLSLRRHVRGRNCRWWSGRRERFAGSNCRRKFFFAAGDDADWSYLFPRRLPPGHYVLDVKALDRARNVDERFERARNRVVFEVLSASGRRAGPPGLRAASAGRSAAAARRRGARVDVMVVGTRGTLANARTVRARSRRVAASGRRCLVAASTPLTALAERLRLGRVAYNVRDFGRCSVRDAGSSGQLFVDRIGDDRNRGQDGWFFKVNHRAGTSGAADRAGLRGGRLRSSDSVLWFYCVFDDAAQSCQRSLEVVASRRAGRTGEALRVRVLGYRNEGGGTPVRGAAVTLGPSAATTDGSGTAEIVLPAPGRHALAATAPGAVPSFPTTVRVL